MKKTSKIICIVIVTLAEKAISAVPLVPVFDATAMANMILEYDTLVLQLKSLTDQYAIMKEQSVIMSENSGYGEQWVESDELWMPENVNDLKDWAALSDEYNYYDKMFPNNPDAIDPHNEVSRERELYEYSAEWNNYSRTAFKKRFDEAQRTVNRINEMLKESNKLDSPKQSADFQIRMMGEVAKLSQQQAELQSLQLHLMTIQLEEVKLSKEHNADFWKYTYEN